MEPAKFCTCRDTTCPFHPTNHDRGCDLCIQKNLKLGEIPSCFFNAVGSAADTESYHYEDFARMVLRNSLEKSREKHPSEKVIFMNMCMLVRGDEVLALDKVNSSYTGITFPGGHVEEGETFRDAVVREMQEETGYTIYHPVLRGIYHWYRDGVHNVGLLYRADQFDGELKSSEEGRVYWIDRSDYEKKDLAVGMPRVLQIMDGDEFTECFMDVRDDGSIVEHMF